MRRAHFHEVLGVVLSVALCAFVIWSWADLMLAPEMKAQTQHWGDKPWWETMDRDIAQWLAGHIVCLLAVLALLYFFTPVFKGARMTGNKQPAETVESKANEQKDDKPGPPKCPTENTLHWRTFDGRS